jgi:cytochrome c-type biogenesis protein CcmH/NrfG
MGLGRHPEDARLWLASGSVLRAAGRDGEAVTAFEKAVLLDPINSTGAAERSAVFLSLLATENGRFEDAERWARSALSWDDTTPENWEYLAIALRSQQELEESLTAFQRSVELDPSRPGTVANLGSVLAELGRYSEAETAFDRVIDLDPTNMTATEGLARLRSRQAKEQEESRRAAQPEPVILNERAAAKPISPKKLGVRFVEIDYDRLGLGGALVREVGKRSPAARTGLRRGDLILRVNGYQILDDKDFFRRLKKNPPVEGLEIEILRDAGIDTLFLRLQ